MAIFRAVYPTFWKGFTGKRLRRKKDAQLAAAYLQTCESSHMIGLYRLELHVLCHETGLTEEEAIAALGVLADEKFAFYDQEHEIVWVREMARFQMGEELNKGDKRIRGTELELERFRGSPFFNAFLERYAKPFKLTLKRDPGPTKPLPRPIEPPSKGLGSQISTVQIRQTDQDQGQLRNEDLDHGVGGSRAREEPPTSSPLSLPERQQQDFVDFVSSEWPDLEDPAAFARRAAAAFPQLDLMSEAYAARGWETSSSSNKRKDHGSWFWNWLADDERDRKVALHRGGPKNGNGDIGAGGVPIPTAEETAARLRKEREELEAAPKLTAEQRRAAMQRGVEEARREREAHSKNGHAALPNGVHKRERRT